MRELLQRRASSGPVPLSMSPAGRRLPPRDAGPQGVRLRFFLSRSRDADTLVFAMPDPRSFIDAPRHSLNAVREDFPERWPDRKGFFALAVAPRGRTATGRGRRNLLMAGPARHSMLDTRRAPVLYFIEADWRRRGARFVLGLRTQAGRTETNGHPAKRGVLPGKIPASARHRPTCLAAHSGDVEGRSSGGVDRRLGKVHRRQRRRS